MEKEYAVLVQYAGKGEWFVYCLQDCLEKAKEVAATLQEQQKTQSAKYPDRCKDKFRAGVRDVSPWKMNKRKLRGKVDDYRKLMSGTCKLNKRYPNSRYMAGMFRMIYDGLKDCQKEYDEKQQHSFFERKSYEFFIWLKLACINALAHGRMTCADYYNEACPAYYAFEKEEAARLEVAPEEFHRGDEVR